MAASYPTLNSPTAFTLYSPTEVYAYGAEFQEDGIYSVLTRTRFNAAGAPLISLQKQMISSLSSSIESKSISVSERNLTSAQWSVYNAATKRTRYTSLPSSDITAASVSVDGFVVSQSDNAGVTTTAGRAYTASGMTITHTDARGNTTTTVTDTAGRTLSVTNAAGNTTTTTYAPAHDLPATVTDAQGNTSCYRYDERGRKVAEWGTGIQPALFAYDAADRMTSLTTFRASTETVSTDPVNRTDGDVTTWSYHDTSGMEIRKSYADGSSVTRTYDAYNRVLTETDARGKVKTHTYEHARGLLLGTSYNDSTTPRSYTYNHLSQLTQVTDAAGTRTLSYNAYGEQESDSLAADSVTHLITENRDEQGRSTGYTYAKNASVQQTVTTAYGSDGRISSAGFIHGGAQKMFGYTYLPGTHLFQTLTKPNNMSLTLSYEDKRDLLTGMSYKRGNTGVANRTYTYDAAGRPITRNTARNGTTVNDSFGYNTRSELTAATVNNGTYSYNYDNIGNRNTAQEITEEVTNYTANNLNQYTAIGDFAPTYDAAGNQTLVKTTTGIWTVAYDAENRPVSFTNAETNTVIECAYDYMGRRATKKVTVDGEVTLHHRYLYRGFLQIDSGAPLCAFTLSGQTLRVCPTGLTAVVRFACCDLTRSNHPALWLITWDSSQPIATRPLAIQKDGTWYTYGWDLTKNICELYGINGYIRTNYTYTPYGAVTESANSIYQPIQWSSEFHDTELALVYYNYRHYNPTDGRWLGRDRAKRSNLYLYVSNKAIEKYDILGLFYILDLTHCGKKALQCSSINKNAGGNECCNPIERPKGVGIVFLNGDEADNSTFMKHAGANGRWLFTPQNGQELLRALEDVTNERCGNCIKNLTIAGHGHSTTDTQNGYPGENMEADEGFYYDSDYSDNILSANISDLSKLITENKIKFCKTCIIQLYGCRTGYSFASSFAKTTGCKVVFASGACSDKNNGDWNSGPGYWGEKSERDECFMGFVEAFPDGSFSKITNPGHNKDSNYTPK